MPAKHSLTVLFLGDVIGFSGCRAVFTSIQTLKSNFAADVVIVNGENSANGFGITSEIASNFFQHGVDVITTGNHVWHDKNIHEWLNHEQRLLRPCNYSRALPGKGVYQFSVRNTALAVVNVQCREYMPIIDCPFKRSREIYKELRNEVKIIIADLHGESSMEKEAYAYYMAGDFTAVLGTHTHIQTKDERIIDNYTAFITDVGACGPMQSVIGFDPEASIMRFTQQRIGNSIIDDTQKASINGVVLSIDTETGACLNIQRITHQSLV